MNLNIEDFISLAKEKKEIRHSIEKVYGEDVHIFHYMISTPELFKTDIEKECRGIVFNDHGECICRPFHKFFNVGEKEETLPHNINWKNITAVTNKVDGSLLTPVPIKGQIFWKTKKSFYSGVAKVVQDKWNKRQEWYNSLNRLIQENINEYTLLFEYISPDNRIVVEYLEETLFFLGKRNISTGLYDVNSFNTYPELLPIVDYNTFIDNTRSKQGEEGYVLYTINGDAYKIKTQWYLDRHHLLSSLSYREIVRLIDSELIDDIISELRIKGFTKQIAVIEDVLSQYKNLYTKISNQSLDLFEELIKTLSKEGTVTKKDFALVAKNFKEFSSILFPLFDNKIEQVEKLIKKQVSTALTEKYSGKVLFMGEEQ